MIFYVFIFQIFTNELSGNTTVQKNLEKLTEMKKWICFDGNLVIVRRIFIFFFDFFFLLRLRQILFVVLVKYGRFASRNWKQIENSSIIHRFMIDYIDRFDRLMVPSFLRSVQRRHSLKAKKGSLIFLAQIVSNIFLLNLIKCPVLS